MENKIRIWEVKFGTNKMKLVEADLILDAMRKAHAWAESEIAQLKKESKHLNMEKITDDYEIVSVSLYCETDI